MYWDPDVNDGLRYTSVAQNSAWKRWHKPKSSVRDLGQYAAIFIVFFPIQQTVQVQIRRLEAVSGVMLISGPSQ